MKEMKYQSTRIQPPDVLETGTYKDYNFFVLNLGTHPCAYVEIPSSSENFGKDYDSIDVGCHGGLTYANKALTAVNREGWFIGWDYAHCYDYSGYGASYGFQDDGKRFSTLEMISDCKEVIDQLVQQDNPT